MRPRFHGLLGVLVLAVLFGGCAGNGYNGNGDTYDDEADNGNTHADEADEEAEGGTGDEEGQVCGGIQGLPCPDGWFCDLPAGECQGADFQGTCVERPEMCTKEYAPVCGCDGQTYGNDCERRAAAVQKDHDGECEG